MKRLIYYLLMPILGISLGIAYASNKGAFEFKPTNSICASASGADVSSGFQKLYFDDRTGTALVEFQFKGCLCNQFIYTDKNNYYYSHIIKIDYK